MAIRSFVDTNVLLYSFDNSEPAKRERAQELLDSEDEEFVISTQVLAEFYVNAIRKLAQSEADAATAVEQLARLPTIAVDAHVVAGAIATSRKFQLSYWDAQIIAAADAAGCDRVLTEDLNHGELIAGIRVDNPFAS